MNITDEEFETLINESMDDLPQQYIQRLNNVAVVIADDPTPEQREKLQMHQGQLLFGLYEGIPLTKRGAGYNLVLPDKITIFKNPLLAISRSPEDLKNLVRHTLWHEIAHYYGLDHDRIRELENK
jgi:predicted Zn-dependent protease with MMP-like domain